MIVRILGERQLDVPDDVLDTLNDLDDRLVEAIDRADDTEEPVGDSPRVRS